MTIKDSRVCVPVSALCAESRVNGIALGSKTVLGFTHVAEQLLFSIVPSILNFDFDSILESFLAF